LWEGEEKVGPIGIPSTIRASPLTLAHSAADQQQNREGKKKKLSAAPGSLSVCGCSRYGTHHFIPLVQ